MQKIEGSADFKGTLYANQTVLLKASAEGAWPIRYFSAVLVAHMSTKMAVFCRFYRFNTGQKPRIPSPVRLL